MNQAVLLDAKVHESPEVGHIGHDAGQLHTGLKVLYRVDVQFLHDVGQGRHAHLVGHVCLEVYGIAQVLAGDKLGHSDSGIGSHLLDEPVALGMHGGIVQRVCGTRYAQETGALFESLLP